MSSGGMMRSCEGKSQLSCGMRVTRQLRAVLRGSVLIAQLLSATLFLQGCDDEQAFSAHCLALTV